MLRLIHISNALPYSLMVSDSATFLPGACAQLVVEGMQTLITVSDGTAPIGIFDDMKTNAFTSVSWDEPIIVPVSNPIAGANNTLVTPYDIKAELANPNVVASSFVSIPVSVQLIPRNGVIVFPAGTPLNLDLTGSGTFNAIKTIVRYSYQIPNVPGEDSTIGSHMATIWYGRGFYETDQFETNQIYPINANLFSSEVGLLTTRQSSPNLPAVGIVTGVPSAIVPTLQFMWY